MRMAWEFCAVGPSRWILAMLLSAVTFPLLRFVYNAFFHPLASIPGPKVYAGSDIPFIIHLLKGDWPDKWTKLHKKYGPVVRVGINEISFINAQAWNDIYGQRTGHGGMEKTGGSSSEGFQAKNIINADNETHMRQRKLLSHAFSDRALGEQEYLVRHHIDNLMGKLHEKAAANETVNLTAFFGFTTFDVLGDLAFGDSFQCLENSTFHPWIAMKISNMKMTVWKNIINAYVPKMLHKFFLHFVPKIVTDQNNEHIRLSREKLLKRMTLVTERPDFMTYILPNNGKDIAMTPAEIESNAHILIIAGSETTATILIGTVYYLLLHPSKLALLVSEVRSAFNSEKEITFAAASRLTYLLAVFNEAFRLYPPVDGGSNRVVPASGAIIDGRFIPGGTHVGLSVNAANTSPRHFQDPERFLPERWLSNKYNSDERSIVQPFGIGPRSCIGRNLAYMEMRLIMARLLWNFELELLPDQEHWRQQRLFVVWEKRPLNVRLRQVRRS